MNLQTDFIDKNIENPGAFLKIQSIALDEDVNGILITDSNGKIIWTNKAFTKLTGYSKTEVNNKSTSILKSGLHPQSFYQNLWTSIIKGNSWEGEITNKRKDGSIYTEEMAITPIKVGGKITNYVAIKRDVSAKNAIRKIEQLSLTTNSLDELLKGMHEAINEVIRAPNCFIALLDHNSKLVSFPYFVDEYDEKPEPRSEQKGRTEYIMNSGKSILFDPKIFDQLVRNNEVDQIGSIPISLIGIPLSINSFFSGALIIQGYDKEIKFCEKDLTWLDSVGKLIETAISKRQSEIQLMENEQKIKSITNSIKSAIITIDNNKEIILWNKASEKLFGYTAEEAIGSSIYKLLIPERFLENAKKRFEMVTGIGKDFNGTFNLILHNKKKKEINTELSVSLTEINNTWHITGIFRELSKTNNNGDELLTELRNNYSKLESDYNVVDSILEMLPQGIYVKDKQARFIKVNKSTLNKFGFENDDEIIGKTDSDLFDHSLADKFIAEEQTIIETGKIIVGNEHLEKMQSGEIRFAHTSKFPLYNQNGIVIGTFGITTDITEKKKREDELKENQYRFNKLVENSTLGILRFDDYGSIIMANPSMLKMLGFSSELDLVRNKDYNIFFEQSNKKRFLQILKKEHKIRGYEDILKKIDGEPIDVRISAWTVRDQNDSLMYFEVITEDITTQNKILKSLHESEFKYRLLIDKLSEAVFLIIGNKVEIANEKTLELFGITEEELFSSKFDFNKFVSEESKGEVKQIFHSFKKGDLDSCEKEIAFVTKQGVAKTVELSIRVINFNGRMAIQGILRDLTDVRKQESQLRHLQKMEAIGTLAAGIAHEINTPSQFINNNLSFLDKAFKDVKPILSFVKEIENNLENVDELSKIIKSVDLDFIIEEVDAAIDQSKLGVDRIAKIVSAMRDFSHASPKHKQEADLHKIINNSITLSRNSWKYISEVETKFDPTLPHLSCHPNELNQVFVNMIVNAAHALEIKFADSEKLSGKILVKTQNKQDHIEIIIKDNGPGMPEEVTKRIFDPFFSTKEVGKGTGQGLSIAYDIVVVKHQGKIEVESQVNIGTTFKINLPFIQLDENE